MKMLNNIRISQGLMVCEITISCTHINVRLQQYFIGKMGHTSLCACYSIMYFFVSQVHTTHTYPTEVSCSQEEIFFSHFFFPPQSGNVYG